MKRTNPRAHQDPPVAPRHPEDRPFLRLLVESESEDLDHMLADLRSMRQRVDHLLEQIRYP